MIGRAAGSDSNAGGDTGWALVRGDGEIIAADAILASLLGVHDSLELVGRRWQSFAPAYAADQANAAQQALVSRHAWSGIIELAAGGPPVELHIELSSAGESPGGEAVLRATALAAPGVALVDAETQLAAIQAAQDASDSRAAARAMLQELRRTVSFDWAVVIEFRAGLGDPTAYVIATYPSAMAGVANGVQWSPLAPAEALLHETGEPSLAGQHDTIDQSPLGRLLSFGMRSVMRVPLFAGADVTGCVCVYHHRAHHFGAEDGLRVESIMRRLGDQLVTTPSGDVEVATPSPVEPQEPPPPHRESIESALRGLLRDAGATRGAVFLAGDEPGRFRARVVNDAAALVEHGELIEPLARRLGGAARPLLFASLAAEPELAGLTAAWPSATSLLLLPHTVRGRLTAVTALVAEAPTHIRAEQTARIEAQAASLAASIADSVHERADALPEALPGVPPEPAAAPPATTTAAPDDDHSRRVEEVLAGVAHELNNPLTAILGYAQMLRSLSGPERDQAISTIEEEAVRAGRILRNLLLVARQQQHSSSLVDLDRLLARLVEVRRYELSVDGVQVELRLGGIPSIQGDEYQLEQVFLQLINNAAQAMRPGGGRIELRSDWNAVRVRVSVADSGPGIPEELLTRVFDPFFTTHTDEGRSGLGLSIANGIVTEHGGRIWAERPADQGTRFVVELPLRAPATAASSPSPGGSVLVVDDGAGTGPLVRESLTAAGFRVAAAHSVGEALQAMDKESFDAIVIDAADRTHGAESLHEQLLASKPYIRSSILLIGDEGAASGGMQVLRRPFDQTQLLTAVRAIVRAPAGT